MEDENERIDEGKILGAKEIELLENTEFKKFDECICKMVGQDNISGTGFFCKIQYKNKLIPVLMTNYHVINDDYISNKKFLKVYIKEKYYMIDININNKLYSSIRDKYDIMIIKLNEDEKIKNFLEIDPNIFEKDSLLSYQEEPIFILHFPNAGKASVSQGTGIEIIDEFDIKHLCNTEKGSSGGPILCSLTNKVIGIHKGCIIKGYNIGTFLKFPLNELNSKYDSETDIKKLNFKNSIQEKKNIFEKKNENKANEKKQEKISKNKPKDEIKVYDKNKEIKFFYKGLEKYDYMINYILLGDSGTGKSWIKDSLLQKELTDYVNPNFVFEFLTIQINKTIYSLKINDASGYRNYLTMNLYLSKNADCAIIVYDITNRESFNYITELIEKFKEKCEKENYILVLVGAKCDLENKRKVSYKEGKKFADEHDMKFYESSSKERINIDEIFLDTAYDIYKNGNKGLDIKENYINENNDEKSNNYSESINTNEAKIDDNKNKIKDIKIHMLTDKRIKYDYSLNYILVGDSSTGKSKIIDGFLHKEIGYWRTFGIDYDLSTIQIENTIYKITIYDFGDDKNSRHINTRAMKNFGLDCAIVVYDITNRESFEDVEEWINICKNNCKENVSLVLVGNKCEQEDGREVSYEEGQKLADKNGMKFYEATYKTGKNINEIFLDTLYDIYRNGNINLKKNERKKEELKKENDKKNCIIY